jgi:hypothetical protein
MVTVLGVALIASIAAAVGMVHHRLNASDAADQGTLTTSEYARAVAIARSEIAKSQATVTRAVAYVRPGTVLDSNLPGECRSGQVLILSLVGHFPHIIFGTGFADPDGTVAPQGPDRWVNVKADAATGERCEVGVSLGRFKVPAGATDLLPSL